MILLVIHVGILKIYERFCIERLQKNNHENPIDYVICRSFNISKRIGITSIVAEIEVISPPTTTIANGFCTSTPTPVETNIGRRPIIDVNAVISLSLIHI